MNYIPSFEILTEVSKMSDFQVDINMANQVDCSYYQVDCYTKLKNKPWITSDISKMIKIRNKIFARKKRGNHIM